MSFWNCFKLEKNKRAIVIVFFKLDQRPKRGEKIGCSGYGVFELEREDAPSL